MAGSRQDREKAAGWEGRPGVIAILVLLISLSWTGKRVTAGQIQPTCCDLSNARAAAAASLMMVCVSVSFLPNGNPMVKQLRIGLGAAVNMNATVT